MATVTLESTKKAPVGLYALPSIVDESLVNRFKFWQEEVRHGMRHNGRFYQLLQTFPIDNRLKACDVGCEQSDQGKAVCITVSRTAYSVWVGL